jgi:hypothetical protein
VALRHNAGLRFVVAPTPAVHGEVDENATRVQPMIRFLKNLGY